MLRLIHGISYHVQLAYRYRFIPTFGCDTIRRFSNNVSEMKKLAGRDFEDLLQVRPPNSYESY
jgi:hypothetical protein